MSTRPDEVAILVVDDDASIRMILTDLFSDAGFRVGEAESPFIAVQKMAQVRYDIIFSDINMPGMTGIELLRSLREANQVVNMVIMTADATMDSAIEAARLGAQDYLHKPFKNLDEVLALAQKLAARVRDERAKAEAVSSLLMVAKTLADSGQTSSPTLGDVGAIAAKAERLLGIQVRGGEKDAGKTTKKDLLGDLADFPMHEILQLLAMMRKTGVLRITKGQGPAAIAVAGGEVFGAEFGRAKDFKAIYRLMAEEGGSFVFHPTPEPPCRRRIHARTDEILMEGMRHMDEIQHLGKSRPPPNLVLAYNNAVHGAGGGPASPLDLAVAERLRSPQEVRVLLDASPEPDLDIYRALIRLRRLNALRILGLRPQPLQPAQPR